MEVRATIQVPTDASQLDFTSYSAVHTFVVTISDPCEDTELLSFLVQDLVSYTEGETLSRQLPVVQDTVSQAEGNGDGSSFCGQRTFSVVNSQDFPFISIEDGDILFDTSLALLDTEYNVEI